MCAGISRSQDFKISRFRISRFREFEYPSRNCRRTVGRVVNGGNDARSQDNLLPGLANVEDVDTVGPGLPQVGLHVHLEVLRAEVALGSEEHLNVLLGGVEDRGEVGRGHLDGLGTEAAACRWLRIVLSRYSIVGGEVVGFRAQR